MKKKFIKAVSLILSFTLLTITALAGETAEPKKDVPPKYDDSLIEEVISEGPDEFGAWVSDNGTAFHIPQLKADTPDAKRINKEIKEHFASDLLPTVGQSRPSEGQLIYQYVLWNSYWNGSIVSLVIDGRPQYSVKVEDTELYHYDFAQGRQLSNTEMVAKLGGNKEELMASIKAEVLKYHDSVSWYQETDQSYVTDCQLKEYSLMSIRDFDKIQLYRDDQGRYRFWTSIGSASGGGFISAVLEAKPITEHLNKTVERSWLTASMKDGVLTLNIKDTPESRMIFNDKIKYNTPYPVTGTYGRYKDVMIGSIGRNFTPYVFLTNDDGRVQFCDVAAGGLYGGFYCSDTLLMKLPEAAKLQENPAGNRQEIGSNSVYLYDHQGSWRDISEYITAYKHDVPESFYGSYTDEKGEYMMGLNSEEMIYLVPSQSSTDYTPEWYTGSYEYLAATPEGLLYRYAIKRENVSPVAENPWLCGIFRIEQYHEDGKERITFISGDPMFKRPLGEAILVEHQHPVG